MIEGTQVCSCAYISNSKWERDTICCYIVAVIWIRLYYFTYHYFICLLIIYNIINLVLSFFIIKFNFPHFIWQIPILISQTVTTKFRINFFRIFAGINRIFKYYLFRILQYSQYFHIYVYLDNKLNFVIKSVVR